MDLVSTHAQIASNILVFDSYRTSRTAKHRVYFAERLRLGTQFVVAPVENRLVLCPSRFVGYADCTMEKHIAFPFKNGSKTTPRISKLLGTPAPNEKAEKAYLALCTEMQVAPTEKTRTYWELKLPENTQAFSIAAGGQYGYPDEVDQYLEGATKRVYVNAYERNEKARQACIDHYGSGCTVCNFDFGNAYGEIGNGFIHVHHLVAISKRGEEYVVDPVKDLRPVCPNCHAMLHTSDPPFLIEELQELINRRQDA